MPKVKQTKAELRQHLRESISFLEMSASAFDAGHVHEAKRLATTIRVIVHDTKNSHSLLSQLGIKQTMGFLDSAYPYDPENLASHHGLVGLRIGGAATRYWAPLSEPIGPHRARYAMFPNWWNKVVIVDSLKAKFSRLDLVLALANKDGGAHVDPALDEAYNNLSRHNSVGWIARNGDAETPVNEVELYSVRQIAHELLTSIERQKIL